MRAQPVARGQTISELLRRRGSLLSDTWRETAADLANRGQIASFPAPGHRSHAYGRLRARSRRLVGCARQGSTGLCGGQTRGRWAWGLLKDTSRVLLDREMDHSVVDEVRDAIAQHPQWRYSTQIADLHVWPVGKSRYAWILSLLTADRTLSAVAPCGRRLPCTTRSPA